MQPVATRWMVGLVSILVGAGGAALLPPLAAAQGPLVPLQSGGGSNTATDFALPRRVVCRTGPSIKMMIEAESFWVTGFTTVKGRVVKGYKDLSPGACAGMEHPDNNGGTASAPNYQAFGRQLNGPLVMPLGSQHRIHFELRNGRLDVLKSVPSQPGAQDSRDADDDKLDALRSWATARDGGIEFSAAHVPDLQTLSVFGALTGAIVTRELSK
jgi:hypothetical protein